MIYSCGVKTNEGTGLLFTGVSGSGKSTTAMLWKKYGNANLIGDERVAIYKRDGLYWLHSTPWHIRDKRQKVGENRLDNIFFISHSDNNHARILQPPEAVSKLMTLAFLPFWDRYGITTSLEFLDDLCHSLPCYHLGFTPDQRAVDYVKCSISS